MEERITDCYVYNAKLSRVIDGDTLELLVDLGFSMTLKSDFRLVGIDVYETRLGKKTTQAQKEKGIAAKEFVQDLLLDRDLLIETHKDKKGKYGRYLADVWFLHSGASTRAASNWFSLTDELKMHGFEKKGE